MKEKEAVEERLRGWGRNVEGEWGGKRRRKMRNFLNGQVFSYN